MQEDMNGMSNYTPRVNDRIQYKEHEGWVYCITDEYFTLEVATTLKQDDLVTMHKKHHVLIVVYNDQYQYCTYLGHRLSPYDDTLHQDIHPNVRQTI